MMKVQPQHKNCPICGLSLDINTVVPRQPIGNEKCLPEPKADDITFCFNCRTILVFNAALNIVIPDDETYYKISHDGDFHRFVNQIDLARKNKPNMN